MIREGDIVSIDAGARVDGWCADSAVSVCVGCVTADACALVDCAEDMLARAITSIRPGIRWSMVAREIEAIAVERGMSVAVDFVGHGIGRALHEAPQVPCSVYASFLEGGDFTLRPGLVLAIEPMVVLESPRRNDRGELVNPAVTLADDRGRGFRRTQLPRRTHRCRDPRRRGGAHLALIREPSPDP